MIHLNTPTVGIGDVYGFGTIPLSSNSYSCSSVVFLASGDTRLVSLSVGL